MNKVVILDYGIGNVKSISNAFLKCGVDVIVTSSICEIDKSIGLVVPGVGAFAHGMEKLKEKGLDKVILNYAQEGKPILGICLGMQLFFDQSTEFGLNKGLGLVPGVVKKLPESSEKLPHISWNELDLSNEALNERGLLSNSSSKNFYFVHSYYVEPKHSETILATTKYSGIDFCSSIQYGNVYGCQFHPEKSASDGLRIISNFKSICEKAI